jgi:predicted nucleic acid-binding protein
VKIYLDVCALNRLFDDLAQERVRAEAQAVSAILERIANGTWTHVSSQMATIEISAMRDDERRDQVLVLLPTEQDIVKLTAEVLERSAELERLGFKATDAVHVAASETAEANALITCDDRLCRRANRYRRQLHVRVVNPVDWLKEFESANDSN